MNCQDILHTYHKRMKREALGKALVIGALSGLAVGSAIMGVSWLSTACEGRVSWLPPAFNGTLWAILAALLITGAVTGILYRFAFRPTLRAVAERVDAMGLEERAVTMLGMAGNDHYMAELQRQDTRVTLKEIPAERLPIRILKIPAAIACALLLVISALIIVPNATGLFTPPPVIDEDRIIEELIEDLRQEIEDAEDVRDEVKEELNRIVDELEESLEGMESTQEKIDKITEVSEQIRDKIQSEQTHTQLGEALKEHENTENLGDAIEKGDTEAVKDALEEIQDKIEQAGKESNESMSEELKDLAASIDQALDKAGQEGDPLTESLENLSSQLKDAADKSDQGDKEAASDKTDQAISDAKQEISEALGEQMGEEKLEQEMQGSMNEALDKLEQSMSQNGQGKETGEGEGKGEEPPEEDLPPNKPGSAQGEPVDTSDVNYGDQDDDPYNIAFKDGETPYTDEYDAYFKQEMAKLEGADMTQEEKEMIARYYASIRMEMEQE